MTGKIYTGWNLNIEVVPHTGRLELRGLNFGFTDPTALVSVYYQDGGYILDENVFQKGISNKQIADIILNLTQPNTLVVADSADPKFIDELYTYGINIQPAEKGADSVAHGIQLVQDQRISVTKRSVNIIKEYRNYLWEVGPDGKPKIPYKPEHQYSHTMDAIRYAISALKKKKVYTQVASSPLAPYYGDRDVAF